MLLLFFPAQKRPVLGGGTRLPCSHLVAALAPGSGWIAKQRMRLILAGVFDRLPSLQIIIGHIGEMIPFMLARINNVLTPVARHVLAR